MSPPALPSSTQLEWATKRLRNECRRTVGASRSTWVRLHANDEPQSQSVGGRVPNRVRAVGSRRGNPRRSAARDWRGCAACRRATRFARVFFRQRDHPLHRRVDPPRSQPTDDRRRTDRGIGLRSTNPGHPVGRPHVGRIGHASHVCRRRCHGGRGRADLAQPTW